MSEENKRDELCPEACCEAKETENHQYRRQRSCFLTFNKIPIIMSCGWYSAAGSLYFTGHGF